MVNAKITVAKMEGTLRIIVVMPGGLDALPIAEQTRAIETALWQAAEASVRFLDRERTSGKPQRAAVTELRVA